jgi:hypothetical protein
VKNGLVGRKLTKNLNGCTFPLDKKEDGHQFLACIVKCLQDIERKLEGKPTRLKVLLSDNNYHDQEEITFNTLLEYLIKDEESRLNRSFFALYHIHDP